MRKNEKIKSVKNVIVLLNIFIAISTLSGCSFRKRGEDQILKEKVVQELEYLDAQIVSMLNKLNNINFENYTVKSEQVVLGDSTDKKTENSNTEGKDISDTDIDSSDSGNTDNDTINMTRMEPNTILVTDPNHIDWITLKHEIELLNSSWSVIILDLYSLKLSSDEILLFSTIMDKCIISIKDENKPESLVNLAELYEYIPIYLSGIPEEQGRRNVKQTKSYIIKSYALVEQNNWAEIAKNMQEAENLFKTIMADVEYTKTREYKVNQTYVLLKELQQSLQTRDHKLFYMKYKNVMESISNLA